MTIDILILCLLSIAFSINLLALGAFWVTPGLRTTANRFVINLLLTNLIGCCILAITLFVIGNVSTTAKINEYNLDIIKKEAAYEHQKLIKHSHTKQQQHQLMDNKGMLKERKPQSVLSHRIRNKLKRIILDPKFQTSSDELRMIKTTQLMRIWSIDMTAALGALSVLLIVGDTWMAVRDPLHYHSRVSGVKKWMLLAIAWVLGISFGLVSAYRQVNFESITLIRKKKHNLSPYIKELTITTGSTINTIFAGIYFAVVILLPFGFVCCMYWRIFSAAKENGPNSRKNRSTPLVQSATDVSHHHHHHHEHHQEQETDDDHQTRDIKGLILGRSLDRHNAIRQIYSTPNFQRFNQGHGNFLTGFESTSNLRYMAHQALQIPSSPSSLDYVISIFKHREESRAARISVLVVIMFLVSYVPYGMLVLLQGFQMIENFAYSMHLAVLLILLANISSPFLFAYRNKRVRHGVIRFLGMDKLSRDYNRDEKQYFLIRSCVKVVMKVKRNRRKYLKSYKYLTSVFKNSKKSFQNTQYNRNLLGRYLMSSTSVQSSILYGNNSP